MNDKQAKATGESASNSQKKTNKCEHINFR